MSVREAGDEAVGARSDDFIPAASAGEAVARIYGLTGAQPHGRGEKRALVALRDALGLDVDVVRTNSVLGAALAARLEVDWDEAAYTDRNKVTLDGLNALLSGATTAFQRGSLRRVRDESAPGLAGPEWAAFQPAISKIEAVTRIAALTGAPRESLGPGSKERKSVLENLADRLLAVEDVDRSSKTRLGRSIAQRLDVAWPDTAYSTGETISLEGLNLILAGAERRLGKLGSSASALLTRPEDEGAALVSALRDGLGELFWDGRDCVRWMMKNGVRGAFDNEWQGFYFEARGREILNRSFVPSTKPPRTTYGHTTFDYALNSVWDLKAHTSQTLMPVEGRHSAVSREAPLNDVEAVRHSVAEQGLGFLVLEGLGVMDQDGSFVSWHRELKSVNGVQTQRSNSGLSRLRKAAFGPLSLHAVWIADTESLDAAIAAGWIKLFAQGRQAPVGTETLGRPRREKYLLRPAGLKRLSVAHSEWPKRHYVPTVAGGGLSQDRLW